jgi:hypothetical protein
MPGSRARPKMNLNRRLEKLENKSPNEYSMLHVIFLADDESNEDAAKRYCGEHNFDVEKLNHVIYIRPEDAATL